MRADTTCDEMVAWQASRRLARRKQARRRQACAGRCGAGRRGAVRWALRRTRRTWVGVASMMWVRSTGTFGVAVRTSAVEVRTSAVEVRTSAFEVKIALSRFKLFVSVFELQSNGRGIAFSLIRAKAVYRPGSASRAEFQWGGKRCAPAE